MGYFFIFSESDSVMRFFCFQCIMAQAFVDFPKAAQAWISIVTSVYVSVILYQPLFFTGAETQSSSVG